MALDLLRLDGKVALITGGGRGTGRAIAQTLAGVGATVVVTARTKDEIDETVRLVAAEGGHALAIEADVMKRSDHERVIGAIAERFGRLNIVVNNAGGSMTTAPFLKLSEEHFRHDFELNAMSAFNCTQLATPLLLESGGGAVVNISSRAASFAFRGRTHYGVAKAALEQLTRRMAQELAPDIRVNAIAVGPVVTSALLSGYAQGLDREALIAQIPLGREGRVEEVGLAALYLCSDHCFITGEILHHNGGLQSGPDDHTPRLRAKIQASPFPSSEL